MATGHRTTNRAKAKARRAKDRRRNHQGHAPVSAWLGAGALTLGIGAAVASGSAVAYAAPNTSDSGSSGSNSAGTTGGTSKTDHPSANPGPTHSPSTGTTSKALSAGSGGAGTDDASTAETSTATTDPVDIDASHTTGKRTDTGTTTGKTGTKVSGATATTTPTVKRFAAALPSASPASTAEDSSGDNGAASGAIGSSTQGATAATQSLHTAALTTPVVKTTAAMSTSSATAAMTPSTVKVNPLEPILDFVRTLLGVNPNVAADPTNLIQVYLYATFTWLQNIIDPAPPAGTPIVGAADPNSGKVTGTAVFATDPSGDVTFTAPATSTGGGAVTVNATTGAFTYTPTQGQRLTATSATTDTFTVTAHDGLSSSIETVTVPVDAGTPIARIPTVGTPDPSTGVVVGNAAFTDPAGRTLTYSVNPTSSGGGAVTIDASTGAFTFTPTATQRFNSPINSDIFTVTASNGVNATDETITVPINNFSNANETTHGFTVTNLSSQAIMYQGLIFNEDGNSIQDQPAVGSILQPGQSQNFSLVLYFFAGSKAEANYLTADDQALGQVDFTTDSGVSGGADSIGTSQCGNCSVSGNTVYFLDAPGTTKILPASDPTGQAEVVENLCGNGNVSCSFKPTKQVETFGLEHPVGSAVINDSDTAVTTTISITDTQAQSDSLNIGAKASGSLLGIVNTEINASYGHTWTNTTAFMQSVTVTVKPNSVARVVAQQPIYRVTGDFTLVMGNTTYIVKDVTFDTPNPNGQGAYKVTDTPITPAAETPSQATLAGTVTTNA